MMNVESDTGKGRGMVVLYEQHSSYLPLIETLKLQCLSAEAVRLVCIAHQPFCGSQWRDAFGQLQITLERLGIRTATFIGFGSSTVLLQALAQVELKKIRTLVFIDPSTRAHPTFMMKCADAIEEYLPMGLPMRLPSDDYDGRSLLQRIRCPVLVVASPQHNQRMAEISYIAEKLPTSWFKDLSQYPSDKLDTELATSIASFQEVPAKCPQ